MNIVPPKPASRLADVLAKKTRKEREYSGKKASNKPANTKPFGKSLDTKKTAIFANKHING